MYWPIIFNDYFSVDVEFMGFIFSGITIFIFLGSQFSGFWQKLFCCEKRAMIFSQLITSLALIGCFAFAKLPFFLSFFLIHEFGRGLLKPLLKAYINNNIDNDNRATLLSLESMIARAGAGLGLIFSGLIADSFGIMFSWLVSAIILFIIIFIFWQEAKKEKY
jgi:predicted MFS family arabinose efflux permease